MSSLSDKTDSATHYGTADLRAYLEGGWTEQKESSLEEHLARCSWCTRRLEALSRGKSDDLDPAALADRYQLPSKVEWKSGGQGLVCSATHQVLQHEVALKVLHERDRAAISCLLNEGRTVARLHHPSIVPVYDVFEWGDRPCLVMEWMPKGTLAERARTNPYSAQEAAAVVAKLADAVHYAHTRPQPILHRDLKPANVLFDEHETPRIADFGLALRLGSVADRAWEGTPSYMAPEQARSDTTKITERTDVYGLAAILYSLLNGAPPHPGRDREQVRRDVCDRAPAPLPTTTPADLAAICMKGLAKSPDERYATADIFAEDLRCFLDGEPVAARPPWPLRRMAMWAGRNRATTAFLLLLLLSLAGLSVWGLRERDLREESERRTASERRLRLAVTDSLRVSVMYTARGDVATPSDKRNVLDSADRVLEMLRETPEETNLLSLEMAVRLVRGSVNSNTDLHAEAAADFRGTLARLDEVGVPSDDGKIRLPARLGLVKTLMRADNVKAAEVELAETFSLMPGLLSGGDMWAAFYYSLVADAVREVIPRDLSEDNARRALALSEKFLALPDAVTHLDFAAAKQRVELLSRQATAKQLLEDPRWETDIESAVKLAKHWYAQRKGAREPAELLWVHSVRACTLLEKDGRNKDKAEAHFRRSETVAKASKLDTVRWPIEAIHAELFRLAGTVYTGPIEKLAALVHRVEGEVSARPTREGVNALLLGCLLLAAAAETNLDRVSGDAWSRKAQEILSRPPGNIQIIGRDKIQSAFGALEATRLKLSVEAARRCEDLPETIPNGVNTTWGKLVYRARILSSDAERLKDDPINRSLLLASTYACLENAVLFGLRDKRIATIKEFVPIRGEPRFKALLDALDELNLQRDEKKKSK